MGGDHKCPVCQATFTRPQHVARHMRSHTGDRPYKCLYCGDQFARSDLLSRHVNKCHSNEKPLPSTTTRRKGSAASRATTSKQACDQCVQSSLPCDGANPCTKCVQRKCRCTFVKFHRQTAPVGPGHVPPPVPPSSNPLEPPSSRLRSLSGSIAPLYAESFDFPPVYPTRLDTGMNLHPACNDYAPRHRANAAEFPNRTTMRDQSSRQGMYPLQTSGTWSGWDQGTIQDSQGMRFSSRDHNPGVGDFGISPTIGSYPLSISTHRRESLDYSGSESSASYSEPSSVPTSARSSTAHIPLGLPLQPLTMQMSSFPASSMGDHTYNQLQPRSHEIRPSTSPSSPASATIPHPLSIQQSNSQALPHGEGSFSSAFGLMSLEDAKVLAGLAADGAPFFSHAAIGMDANTDPDATPMPMQMDQRSPHSQHPDDPSRLLPKVNMTQPPPVQQPWSSVQSFPAPTRADREREGEARELREFWREYMRTPLSGPGIGGGPTDSPGGGMYRRPRVNSLPAKTPLAGPGITGSYGYGMGYSGQPTPLQAPGIGTGMPVSMALPRRPSTGMAVTFPPSGNAAGQQTQQTPQVRHWHGSVEDLRSYEAAVLARQAPTNLSLKPKRRGTTSVVGSGPGLGSGGRGSASVGASPRIPSIAPGAFRGGDMAPVIMKAENPADQGSRRWDGMEVEMTATMPLPPPSQAALSTSSSSSSLANVFGSSHVAGKMQPPSAGCRMSLGAPSDYAGRSESNASPAPGWRQVSRESSLSVSDGSPRSMACEVGGLGSPGETMARPPFKRLPSQTLEPVNAKRTQLRAPGEEASDEERQEPRSGKERLGMTLAERRRRMSVGSGKASARFELDLGTLEKW